jgi:hypothetical protein
MILIRKTAARPADDGNLNFFQRGDDVIADPARVWNGTVLADPDAIVNATAEMLGKLPVNVPADGVRALVGMDDERALCGKRGRGIIGSDRLNLGNGKRCKERKGVYAPNSLRHRSKFFPANDR